MPKDGLNYGVGHDRSHLQRGSHGLRDGNLVVEGRLGPMATNEGSIGSSSSCETAVRDVLSFVDPKGDVPRVMEAATCSTASCALREESVSQ